MLGLSDGLGSRHRVRKKSPLFCWSRGEIEPVELSRWQSCLCIFCPGHERTSKTVPGLFSRTLYHHMEPKGLRCGFQNMFKWAPSFPDLILLDFGIWSYLESKVSTVHHQSLEALKVKLRDEWAKLPQKVVHYLRKAFSQRLQLVIDADSGAIEWYFGKCLSKPHST